MLHQKISKAGVLVTFIICCALVALSAWLIINKQYVIDRITVWQYVPTSELAALVDRTGMNDNGKFLFFASQPKLDATQSFNTECDRVENVTSILGCFIDYRIYIYDVTDPQLDGIREATAAHEMLHAAYIRMGESEKKKVNALIESEYKNLEINKSLADLMKFYARTEPGQSDNELHSIIGTEVANISPELESYYKQYFSDRQKIVKLKVKYSSVFEGLESRANELVSQMNALSQSISDRSSQYNSEVKALNVDIIAFDKRADSGDFSSQSQFDRERSVLSSRVTTLSELRSGVNEDIVKYNTLLVEYNSIASQSKKLNNSIDSTLAPAPSV